MRILLLRGQVPTDRKPKEICFETIEECDDIYTQITRRLAGSSVNEIWYWGKSRTHKYDRWCTERWIPKFKKNRYMFKPKYIWARGGFKEYDIILNSAGVNTTTMYYGAGQRFLPVYKYKKYHVLLQDSIEQLRLSQSAFPSATSVLWVKPAADNIICPVNADKKYDICFPANEKQPFKGFDFVYKTVPKGLKVLHLGNRTGKFHAPKNIDHVRCLRKKIKHYYSQCKVGIVCTSKKDSAPRVIPEMLACGLPVIVLDRVRFWKSMYLGNKNQNGCTARKNEFWDAVRYYLRGTFPNEDIVKYYHDHLSIDRSVDHLRNVLKGVS